MTEHIHLLKLREGPQVTAKCGASIKLKGGERLPETFTVWACRATCVTCTSGSTSGNGA